MMQMMSKMETSRWWWFDSHDKGSKRSQWLQSTLSELENKIKAMLKLIEEDADSFAKRAEMYYKKRPELISLVGDFYRSHRLLAERYDQIKSGSPFGSMKFHSEKTMNLMDKIKTSDSSSETFDSEDYAESEVEDPCQEDKYETSIVTKGGQVEREDGNLLAPQVRQELSSTKVFDDEVRKIREELEKLKEENKVQQAQLIEKDKEKKEVIRQLSFAVQALKDENMELKKSIGKVTPRKWSPFEFNKTKRGLFGMLFNGSPKSRSTVVAL